MTAEQSRTQRIPPSEMDPLFQSSNSLDEHFSRLKLPSVTPESFLHLAPSKLVESEKPYLSRLPHSSEIKWTNIVTQNYTVPIHNVSGNESLFKLADSGFEFAKCPIRIKTWCDSSVSEYLTKLSEWLKQRLNCSRIFVYAYNFRGLHPNAGRTTSKKPFLRAHCDATAKSCWKRLQLYFPNEAPKLMKGRVRFLNVWRPISTPVQDCPLAFCDFRTVTYDDLVAADIIFPHYCDEAYEVRYSPAHRWVYKKGMEWDDVVLFKLGDNSETEAPLCPHSAFMDPSVPKDTPGRVSIEVRVIAMG